MPGNRARVEVRGQASAVNPRRADLLEGRVGATTHRQVAVLDAADARIQRRLQQVPHVRRRVDPLEAELVEPAVARPVPHRDHVEVAADLRLDVEQLRQFAQRHAVPRRHRRDVAGEPDAALVERGAFDLPAANRVRAVEHDDANLPLRRLLHHVRHRRAVGVEADAHVLQIDHERVDALQHLVGGTPRRAVERMDDQARLLVLRRRDVLVDDAANAVLGAEERDERDVGLRRRAGRWWACRRRHGRCGWSPGPRAGPSAARTPRRAGRRCRFAPAPAVAARPATAPGRSRVPVRATCGGTTASGMAEATTLATRARSGVASPLPAGCTRLVRMITNVRVSGSIHSDVPVNPVWPNDPTGNNSPRLAE